MGVLGVAFGGTDENALRILGVGSEAPGPDFSQE